MHLYNAIIIKQAVGVARYDNHDSFRGAENAQLWRGYSAELADGDWGQLSLD